MYSNINFLLFFVAGLSPAFSYYSDCPDLEAVDINSSISHGVWYEHARYPYDVEKSQKCVSFLTSPQQDGFKTVSAGIPRGSPFFLHSEGTIIPNQDKNGIINFTITSDALNKSANLIVKYLGYDNSYFVAYGCKYDEEKLKWQGLAWIFSRTKQLQYNDEVNINNTLNANKVIDYNKFLWVDNTVCEDKYNA